MTEIKEKTSYYACLLEPYINKYGEKTSTKSEIKVRSEPNESINYFYSSFGEKNSSGTKVIYPENFTELDYVKKHKKIIMNYGNGTGEYETVPCKLYKKTEIIETIVEEII